jgi:hypothetical protein
MTSHELFAAMPGALAAEILEFNHENEKKLTRSLGRRRPIPEAPVRVSRTPAPIPASRLADRQLKSSSLNQAADSLLRNWLLKKHSALLIDFLNALGIKHENGVVEELPKSVGEAELRSGSMRCWRNIRTEPCRCICMRSTQ